MAYTGAVRPGGDPDVRELARLRITKIAVDPEMSNNCYLLTCLDTGEQLLVDAAAEPETLLSLVASAGGNRAALSTVVTTHQHWDHHRALADVVAATGADVVAGEPDADAITEQTGVDVTHRVGDGDIVTVGSCSLEVIHLVGHTPGSIALRYSDPDGEGGHDHLFTGDALFPGGVGKTWSDDDFGSLVDDVETKLFGRLDDDTWFYPGHGDDGVLGDERPHLTEWRERGW